MYTYCSNNPIIYTDPTGHWTREVHITDTKKWATQELNKYITKDIVVYKTDKKGNTKTDKKGNPLVDDKKTAEAKKECIKDNKKLVTKYVNDLTTGDEYVDQETNMLHNNHTDNILFHGFEQKGKASNNLFVNDRKSTAVSILNSDSFSKNSTKDNIKTYITNPINTLAGNTEKTSKSLSTAKAPTTYFSSKEEAAMFTLGMGLHTVQDTEAHFKDKHNVDYSDNTKIDDWKYNAKTEKYVFTLGSDRIKATEKLTRNYIKDFVNTNGDKLSFEIPK